MGLIPPRFVGGVTAVFVLLCHVYCACGGVLSSASSAPQAAPPPASETRPQCHGHRDVSRDARYQPGGGTPTSPEREHDSSCQHCKPALAAGADHGKGVNDLKPSFWHLAVPTSLASVIAPEGAGGQFRLILGDLPPPRQRSTLLSLHCALNT